MSQQHAVLNSPTDADHPQARAVSDLRRQLLKGVPIQETRLNVNGTDTSVLEAGTGLPLILLHGGIECGGVYWASVISRLSDGYRVVVPDVPGLGQSAPFAVLDAQRFANWFSELLRLTCDDTPPQAFLAALHSALARPHPERMRNP